MRRERLDFDDFHRRELPARLVGGNGRLAASDVRGVSPIAFRLLDGGAYTYVPADDAILIVAGVDSAETVAELAEPDWRDFVAELHTAAGLVHGGRAQFTGGGYAHFERWEPALRAMFDGRPIYDPSALALPAPLDRAFTLDDPALGAFLQGAGFALVKDVFTRARSGRSPRSPIDSRPPPFQATAARGGRATAMGATSSAASPTRAAARRRSPHSTTTLGSDVSPRFRAWRSGPPPIAATVTHS